jgi:hypothetical protein
MSGRNAVTVLECCATSLRAGKKVIMSASQEQALNIDDLSSGQSEECSNFFVDSAAVILFLFYFFCQLFWHYVFFVL